MAPKKSGSSKKGKAKTGSSSANPDVKKEVALDVQESMPMAGSERQDEIATDITYKMINSKILREGFEQMDEILTKMKDIHKKLTMDYYIEQKKTFVFLEKLDALEEEVDGLRNNVKGLQNPPEPKGKGKIVEAVKQIPGAFLELLIGKDSINEESKTEEKTEEETNITIREGADTDDVNADDNIDNIDMQEGFKAMKKLIEDMSAASQKFFDDYRAQEAKSKAALRKLCDLEVEKANLEEELQRLKKDKK